MKFLIALYRFLTKKETAPYDSLHTAEAYIGSEKYWKPKA